jgi:uncharacterized FlaG/YvyC family protein
MTSDSFSITSAPSNYEVRPSTTSAPQAPSPDKASAASSQQPQKKADNGFVEQQLQLQQATPAEQAERLAQKAKEEHQKDSEMSREELEGLLNDINNALYSMNRSLRFEVHDKTEDLVVRVVNTKTDEVIRQYPSEDVLDRRERLLAGETEGFSTKIS